MSGKGQLPKEPSTRARRNKDSIPLRVIEVKPVTQPSLPSFYFVDADGKRKRFSWPSQTQRWWRMWADSPLSREFTETDWSELLDTALLHALFWRGETKHAAELRLRVAKFGATPEDRARLRIMFAVADRAEGAEEQDTPAAEPDAATRYAGLRLAD